jgi:hypothetical protein
MEHLKSSLLAGKTIVFNNEIFAETSDCGIMEAECDFKNNHFRIWFNGKFVNVSITFEAFEKKLLQLKKDWDLQLKSW